MQHSPYYNPEALTRETQAGRHREAIGGLWEELGELQLSFLKSQGMQPRHRLLDVGCGALRLGVKAVDYLNAGHYSGIDLSEELIAAGYEKELTQTQRNSLPRTNLISNDQFDFTALKDVYFDFAIAQSVFTHLPLNHIRRCLQRVLAVMKPGGIFYATAWILPPEQPVDAPFVQSGSIGEQRIVTYDLTDPYHYHFTDFEYLVADFPCQARLLGDWGHPRGQAMLSFHKS